MLHLITEPKAQLQKITKKNSVKEPTRFNESTRKHIDQVEHAYSNYDTGYGSFIVKSEAMFAHIIISDQRYSRYD